MSKEKEVVSSLRRARMRLLSWLELLPEDMKLDATVCANEMCDEAEREIDRAYWDGYRQYRLQTQLPKKPLVSPSDRETP